MFIFHLSTSEERISRFKTRTLDANTPSVVMTKQHVQFSNSRDGLLFYKKACRCLDEFAYDNIIASIQARGALEKRIIDTGGS